MKREREREREGAWVIKFDIVEGADVMYGS